MIVFLAALIFSTISAYAADTTRPTGTIKINNNAQYTNSISVILNLSAQDNTGGSGLSQMQFSNNNSTWSTPEAYAATKSWTLVSGDGTKTVYVKYKDTAGNWSGVYSDNIILDTASPTGSIKINNGAVTAVSSSVTLNLSASDSRSGLSQMQFSNDNVTWSTAQTYATTKSWTLASGGGTKTVYAKYKDVAGNWSIAYSDTIILDTVIPTGSIKVNNDAQYVASTSVVLSLSAQDNTGGSGLSQMKFSNNNSTWSTPEAYAATKSWTLVSGDGTKTVYVKYKDTAGNWSGVYSDNIILDTASPTGTIKINNGAVTAVFSSVTLNLSASDSRSGLSQMQFSNDKVTWSAPESYATSKAWTLTSGNGTKYVYAKYKDNAGNWSSAVSDSIVLSVETAPPTGSIKVNSDAQYTSSVSVTLNLSAQDNTGGSGLSQMLFSNNNSTWSTPEAYAATKSWSLPSGDGVKTVYVKFSDKAGNWSTSYSDSIALDTIPPQIVITDPKDGAVVNVSPVTVSYAVDGVGKTKQAALVQGQNTISITETDVAGNVASSSIRITFIMPPVADFTATPLNGTAPVTIQFTDKSAGNITAYTWDFGDGQTSAAQNPSHTYTTAGDRAVSLTVTGPGGSNTATKTGYIHIIENQPPQIGAIMPSAGTSKPNEVLNFTTTSIDPDGYQDITYVYFLVTPSTVSFQNCFYSYYDVVANKIYLLNDTSTDWIGGYAPGSSYSIENSSVKIDCSKTTVLGSGTTLTMVWNVTFKPAFVGVKMMFLGAMDKASPYPSLTQEGTWTIVNTPHIVTTSLPDGTVGKDYAEYLNAVDGTTPYTWSVDSGSLPDGLALDGSTGKISGKPKVTNTFNFTVKVTDSIMAAATQPFSIKVSPVALSPDEQLLDETEAKAASYFYNEVLSNGFVKDGSQKDFSSISATGFGMASLCVMAERYGTTANWTITPVQARARVNQILDNCIKYQNLQSTISSYGVAGFLYHFIIEGGTYQGGSEISTIDMALFLAGAITAGEYFGGEVKDKADQILSKVDWNYFLIPSKKQFSHGCYYGGYPIPGTWDRPGDEAILVSLMALASAPDNEAFLETMYSWPRTVREYAGYKTVNSYFGSLFTYIFGHCFFDFEKLGKDNPLFVGSPAEPVDWWANSVQAAYADRQFCTDQSVNYLSYGADSWGISACEYPNGGYAGLLGAAPCEYNSGNPIQDGTIAPYAAISCLPFMRTSPNENLGDNLAFKALKYFHDTYYNNLWGPYGPRDSFNQNGEFNPYYYGLDLGSIVIMTENYRSHLIWDTFMNNEKIKAATAKVFSQSDPLPQKTLYVDASNAGDSNQDGSQAHPFDKIQEAIDAGGMNTLINISPGQYAEAVNIVSKLKVTLTGVIADRVNPTNAQANAVMINGGITPISVTIDGSREVTIDGIVIAGDGRHGTDSVCGILAKNSNTVSIKNSIIQDLGTQPGDVLCGGIMCINNMKVVIADNLVRNNYGYISAGISVQGSGIQGEVNDAAILHNNVINNFAYSGSGGIRLTNIANVSVTANRVFNNRELWYGGYGSIEPGLTVENAKGGNIVNNLIFGNYLYNGYGYNYGCLGINCYSSNVVIANNITMTGGIYFRDCSPIIHNNIIYEGITHEGEGSPVLTYNDADLNSYHGCSPGLGSISGYPLFVSPTGDPNNGDYHLQLTSPCIDVGDPDSVYNDIDGTRNDMGIYGGPTPMPDGT